MRFKASGSLMKPESWPVLHGGVLDRVPAKIRCPASTSWRRHYGRRPAVVADFGELFPASHRIHRPELAGGPMLDLGTYLISFVLDVVGPPDHIIASGTTTGTGVMGQTAMLLSRGDQQAVLHTTILANTPTAATIAGTAATIEIDGPFYQPGGFTLTAADGSTRLRYDEPRSAHEGFTTRPLRSPDVSLLARPAPRCGLCRPASASFR